MVTALASIGKISATVVSRTAMSKTLKRSLVAAALIATNPMTSGGTPPASADSATVGTASAAEIEFWKSADRIGTADAYRAYLKAFPTGIFAPLAQAALAKLGSSVHQPRDQTGSWPERTEGQVASNLKHFEEWSRSGAIRFKLGERFRGPGILTVGWLGAKKQVVIPAGEWLALAAVDHDWGTVKGTTLVFGKFLAERLASALVVTTNRHPIPRQNWAALDDCEKPNATRLYEWRRPNAAWQRECMFVTVVEQPFQSSSEASVQVLTSLRRLGARLDGFALAARLYLYDEVNGMLFVERLDWPEATLGDVAGRAAEWTVSRISAVPARATFVREFVSWMNAYRGFVVQGFRRDIPEPDLQAGAPAPSLGPLTGVGDFNANNVVSAK